MGELHSAGEVAGFDLTSSLCFTLIHQLMELSRSSWHGTRASRWLPRANGKQADPGSNALIVREGKWVNISWRIGSSHILNNWENEKETSYSTLLQTVRDRDVDGIALSVAPSGKTIPK